METLQSPPRLRLFDASRGRRFLSQSKMTHIKRFATQVIIVKDLFQKFSQVICFIHFLESPLKHMLEMWDLGPGNNDTFITNGPIAKAIKYLKLKAFVKFQAMRDILIPAGKNNA